MKRAPTELDSLVKRAARSLACVESGGRATIWLPFEQPSRREAYRRIAGHAHRLWGVGSYKLESLSPGDNGRPPAIRVERLLLGAK
jgi:hypothetical protein